MLKKTNKKKPTYKQMIKTTKAHQYNKRNKKKKKYKQKSNIHSEFYTS